MPADDIEKKIIEATIECVEMYGLKGANNRRIAEKAGVNIAAINYYFRSKENLIARMMETTLNNAFDWEDFATLPGETARERCAAIFENLIRGGCAYPGISRAHFYELVANGNYESQIVGRYNDFIKKLVDDLMTRKTSQDRKAMELACAQVASACFMAILAPKLNLPALGLDFSDENTLKIFVHGLTDKLL